MPLKPHHKADCLRIFIYLAVALLAGLAAGVALAPALQRLYTELRAPKPDQLSLRATSFTQLPGWEQDAADEFLPAFVRSCKIFLGYAPDRIIGSAAIGSRFGAARDWADACKSAAAIGADAAAARNFIEQAFVPMAVANRDNELGRFTGYYEPQLRGSLNRHGEFKTPLLRAPDDLIRVDLGAFRPGWRGEKIAGRIKGDKLLPLPPRSEINAGALDDENLPLLFVDDPIDAFFLHIQGSGRVRLDDGRLLRLGYAGQNGHAYVAIGKVLLDRGELARENISMQSIRAWLTAHPDSRDEVMNSNPSFVFFRMLEDKYPDLGPPGAQNVALTPGRSLAVDPGFLALGLPVWLDTVAPGVAGADQPLQRLMVAQDTGGAIKGPVRGDVFWGFGEQAAEMAGRMNSEGRIFILLPRKLVENGTAQ